MPAAMGPQHVVRVGQRKDTAQACLGVLSAHSGSVLALATAAGLLLSGGSDGTIRAWPLRPAGDAVARGPALSLRKRRCRYEMGAVIKEGNCRYEARFVITTRKR